MTSTRRPTNNRPITIGEILEGDSTMAITNTSEDMAYLPADGDQAEDDIQADIDRIISEVGGEDSDASITVWRKDADNKKRETYLYKVSPADFCLDDITTR